ncbi:ABC transporter ATP-binding protein, partial [Tritonibacter sp. SIMBA_163]
MTHKGHVMEAGPADPILRAPPRPYTPHQFTAAPKIPDAICPLRYGTQHLILELPPGTKTFTLRPGKSWSKPTLGRACE